jgi:hypothetical protein
MKIFCYVDGSDYLCEYRSGTYRLGEAHGSRIITLDHLSSIQGQYPESGISKEVLDAAIKFAVEDGFIVESYADEQNE